MFDLVLADSAWSESTFAKAQADVDGDIQTPSAELNAEIEAAAARVNKPLTKARIHSSDVFYHEDNVDGHREFFEKHGCVCCSIPQCQNFKQARCLPADHQRFSGYTCRDNCTRASDILP